MVLATFSFSGNSLINLLSNFASWPGSRHDVRVDGGGQGSRAVHSSVRIVHIVVGVPRPLGHVRLGPTGLDNCGQETVRMVHDGESRLIHLLRMQLLIRRLKFALADFVD